MDRTVLTDLLAAAKERLARTETRIRTLLGAMTMPEGRFDITEAKQRLNALQQMRIDRVLEVHGIQDEIAALRD
jgi:hypothetical protein